ncbi:glycosyltransferase family 1 protein [Microbacterium testaceum]|uniref:glycosyltransferase family 4 protein n=1 Tax=Microbacterium testaceum TaxID=2033 RepID=UPI003425EA6F
MTSLRDAVVVNGRFLAHATTGVQRFAREIVRELAPLVPLVVAAPPVTLLDADLGARIVPVGRRGGHAWEQLDLPAFLRRSGSPLLLGLASTGPSFYRPQIVAHHDITYVRHPESFARSFRLLYRVLIPSLLRTSARVLTVSDFSAGEIAEHYRVPAEKLRVVPNAVSSGFSPDGPAHDEGQPYLLAVSSPNRHKNFDALLRAFESAELRHIRRLLIVGGQARAFRSGRGDAGAERVRFLGRVDDHELAALYRGAAAFAFPSLYEGFGIPPLEAQRAGTPVLASRAASLPAVLGESVLWVDPRDVADMRRGIERLDRDESLRAELTQRGRANEQRFSWAASARRVAEVIAEVRAETA